jgi:cell division protein FtsA
MVFFTKKTQTSRRGIIAALDIGASKVCCAIAKVTDDPKKVGMRSLDLIGIGQQLSRGMKGGIVVDLDALEESILNAVHSAEQMADETIESVYVNLPTTSAMSHAVEVELPLSNQAIDETHLRRLLSMGRSDSIPADHQIIHALPLSYSIDGNDCIKDPRGLFGQKLGALFHLVTAPKTFLKNIESCVGRCHLSVAGFVISPYASGLSTLVEDELELGVTIIDMGGGNTSIASFLDGTLIHVDNIPLGGAHITSDIARGLSTPLSQAERLKTLYGTVIPSTTDERESILVPQLGEQQSSPHAHHVPKSFLTQIVRARAEEIMEHVWKRLKNSGMEQLVCQRIVLTGGGSQLPGIREMATQFWGKQIRIGHPLGLSGISDITENPMFSTCAGLLQYGWRDLAVVDERRIQALNESPNLWNKITHWVRENF